MRRLFVGIPLTEEIKKRIKPVWDSLKEAEVKVVPLGNLHLTIKFLGEVEESKISEINSKLEILAKNKQLVVKFGGIGTFWERQIRVVWIGVESLEIIRLMKQAGELLNDITKDINNHTKTLCPSNIVADNYCSTINVRHHIYPEEHREEVPHLTLARVNKSFDEEKLKEAIERYQKAEFGEMRVEKLYLYESKLTPEGPVYKVVGELRLN